MTKDPDFVIIGAMKCATSTLHSQLARQPGIFMSEPKEPCFFSDDAVFARGIAWYRSLFSRALPGDLCGESSTHYTKLPTFPATVKRMREHLPHVRLVYVMRHPVERLLSQYVHEWSERRLDVPIDQAVKQHPELIEYSLYGSQLGPYFDAFGPERVLPVFFERLIASPQIELERVCEFIAHRGGARWDESVERDNVSSERLRRSPLRDAVVRAPVLSTLRRRLVPKVVRARVKRLWTLPERPRLSGDVARELEARFDRDLAKLSDWVGFALSCETFRRLKEKPETPGPVMTGS